MSGTPVDGRQAIEAVMARYFHFVDTKQWSELRETFTDTMTMWAPDDVAGAPPLVGGDRVVRMIERVLGPSLSVHRGSPAEVEFIGADEARAIWAMEDVVEYPDAPQRNFRGSGHYHATFARTPSGWRIASLVLRRSSLDRG